MFIEKVPTVIGSEARRGDMPEVVRPHVAPPGLGRREDWPFSINMSPLTGLAPALAKTA